MKDILKTIIKDFHLTGVPQTIQRNLSLPLDSGKIITVIGPRRAGKTYLMYQLISTIPDITNSIYINFEDERLQLAAQDLQSIFDAYFELYPDKNNKDIYLFFDEIQEVPGWEKFVRRAYDTITRRIFITGSSAKMLSKELATALRGRSINYEVYPLSFKEFLHFKGIEEDLVSTRGKAKVSATLQEYMQRGGFPETVDMDEDTYTRTIQNYFDVMLYRDIIERHDINNPLPVKELLKRLVAQSAREFSGNKMFNELKSKGLKISKDSVYVYLDYFEDAFIIFPVHNYAESVRKQTSKKIYAIDTGLSRMLSFSLDSDFGRLLENIVYLELRRRGKLVFYHNNNGECDFVIKEKNKITQALQVCYKLTDDNRERETKGLKDAMKRFGLRKGTIITLDHKETAGEISIIQAQEWLLGKA